MLPWHEEFCLHTHWNLNKTVQRFKRVHPWKRLLIYLCEHPFLLMTVMIFITADALKAACAAFRCWLRAGLSICLRLATAVCFQEELGFRTDLLSKPFYVKGHQKSWGQQFRPHLQIAALSIDRQDINTKRHSHIYSFRTSGNCMFFGLFLLFMWWCVFPKLHKCSCKCNHCKRQNVERNFSSRPREKAKGSLNVWISLNLRVNVLKMKKYRYTRFHWFTFIFTFWRKDFSFFLQFS